MKRFSRVLLIVNPASGLSQGQRTGERLQKRLLSAGIDAAVRQTTGPGDAVRWARAAAANGFDLVVAIGGDGTFQEVVAGMATADGRVPVTQLPVGTANVVAMALALPYSTRLAMKLLETGQVLPFDVGYLPDLDRHFVLMAAIGYPARVIQDSPRRWKRLFGFLTYIAAGFKHSFRRDHFRLEIHADGRQESVQANTVLIANIGRFKDFGLRVSPDTSPHDGRFDISVISSRSLLDVIKVLFRMLTWRYRPTRRLRHFQARRLSIAARPAVPVQIDGEVIGSTPLRAEVKAGAVEILVPKRYAAA